MDKAPIFNTKIVLSTNNDAYAVANLLNELGYLPAIYFEKNGKYNVQFNKTEKRANNG